MNHMSLKGDTCSNKTVLYSQVMEQENRTLFARRHNLKCQNNKRQKRKSAACTIQPRDDNSSSDEEVVNSSVGAIATYAHNDVEEG